MRVSAPSTSSIGRCRGGILFPVAPFLGIALSANQALDSASVGDAVGIASIAGTVTGTAAWSLTVDAGGKYAINSSTGTVTVAAALTAETDSITIAVSGLTPSVASATFGIVVSASGGSYTPSLDFSDSRNSMYIPLAA